LVIGQSDDDALSVVSMTVVNQPVTNKRLARAMARADNGVVVNIR